MDNLKLGDLVTVRIPANDRHIDHLLWWHGAQCVVAGVWQDRYLVRDAAGYTGWFDRSVLVPVNDPPAEAA